MESIYEHSLYYELISREFEVKKHVAIPVRYKNILAKDPLYLDLLVEDKVIVEIKATDHDHPVYQAQLLTYLRLTGVKLGLLINFGQECVKDGISRVVNGL